VNWLQYLHSRDTDSWEILIERRAFEAREEIRAHCDDYLALMHQRLEHRERMYRNLPKFFPLLGNHSGGHRSNHHH